MSKVIRNIATQHPIWTSQPQDAVCVIPEFSQGIVFLSSIRANCVNGKKPVASGTGLFSEVNVGGEVAGLDGTGTGRYDFTVTDSPFYTVVWYGSILGSGTSTVGRIFSTLNGSGGHELYCSGGNLLFDTWFSAGSGQGTFPVSFSEKPICIVATYDASNGTNRPDVWVEGKKITLSGGTSSGSRLAGGTTLAFGGRASSTDRQGYQKILLAGYVARKISGDLAQSLSANPYQIFQPLARQVPFDLVRGPAEPRQSYMVGTTAPEVSTAMPAAILKTGWTSQPQGVVPALRNGVKASSIFVPKASLYGALHSTHFISVGAGGREFVMPYFSATRVSAGHGNVSFSAEWTIVCVYRRNAEGIGWGRAFSAGSESATSAVFGLAYGVAGGSFGQLYIVVSGSNASSVGNYSPTDTDPVGVVSVQVFTCKGGVATSWKNGGLKVAGVAANIGSVNAGQMYLGSQVGGQSGGFNILGLITLPYGLSDRDGRDLSANPWQIFAPQSKQIWVTT